jgi:hypothetical protein
MTSDGTTSEPEHALIGTVVAGRYRVDRLVGVGGMGAVFLAEHVLMHKTVALKVLHREMTVHPEIVARFEREAVAAARIDHPNVAAAMDFGRLEDGSCYLVLEYVGGQSLRELVAGGPLDTARALGVARQIAHALAAAHEAGIVHRDLKPDNVMLVPQPDGSDLVKVLDFGIAKLDGAGDGAGTGKALTRIGTVMGTAGYMAPEQALGQSVDHRADLYAFGVVLYEMIAGRIPFFAEEVTQILAKQLTERPPALPEGTPEALSALIGSLLEKSAEDRIRTTAEVVERIDGILLGPGAGAGAAPDRSVAVQPGARGDSAAESGTPALELPFVTETGGVAGGRRRTGMVGAALGVGLLGVVFLWRARANEPSQGAPAAATVRVAPSAAASASIAARAPSSVPAAVPAPAPSAAVSAPPPPEAAPRVTETRTTTTQPNGTTTRTTRRTTTREQTPTETRTKRRTGPGGIYIPPPSQWFK